MRPQSAKGKGRRFQQRVVASILEAFPALQPDDVVSTSMGCGGEDVRLSPAARAHLPLSLEAKCHERLNVWTALEQAKANCPAGATPCVVFSRNRAPTYAVVPWPVLLALYRQLDGGQPRSADAPPVPLPPRLAALLRELAHFAPPAGEGSGGGSGDGVADGQDAGEEEAGVRGEAEDGGGGGEHGP